jgi:YegS/Rv2252/BmrU family lipid kinase
VSAAIIINPVAGGRRSLAPEERVRLAERALARHRIAGRVEVTRAAGHGAELARQAVADRCEVVVAWGGDGTINEVASELVGTGTSLGIVRAGSGNGLARELGIPPHPDQALDTALIGRDRDIDAGQIDSRRFFNVAGIGFDAAMAASFNRLGGERRGPIRYTRVVAGALLRYRAAHYAIEVDGRRLETDALIVAIANLSQYGSNAFIAPGARPDDGLLDVMVIGKRGAIGRIGLLARAYARTVDRAADVIRLPTTRVVVRADEPILFHVDGEPRQGGTSVEARIIPAAIHVRVKQVGSEPDSLPLAARRGRRSRG